jgi:hypothetical protein
MNGVEFLLDTNVVIGLLKGHEAATSIAESSDLDLIKAAISQTIRTVLLSFNVAATAMVHDHANY